MGRESGRGMGARERAREAAGSDEALEGSFGSFGGLDLDGHEKLVWASGSAAGGGRRGSVRDEIRVAGDAALQRSRCRATQLAQT